MGRGRLCQNRRRWLQQRDRLHVAGSARELERPLAGAVARRWVGTVLEQELDESAVPSACCRVQARGAVAGGTGQIGALHPHGDHSRVPRVAGRHQRVPSALILGAQGRSALPRKHRGAGERSGGTVLRGAMLRTP